MNEIGEILKTIFLVAFFIIYGGTALLGALILAGDMGGG